MKTFNKKGFAKFLLLLLLSLTIAITGACGLKGPMIPKSNIPVDIDADVKREIERLYSSSAMERQTGVSVLGDFGKRAAPAAPFLIDMLKDKEISVRKLVASALGKIGDPRAIEPLIAVVLKSEPEMEEVRLRAVSALADIKDHRAVEALISALPLIAEYSGPEKFVGLSAATALGKIGDSRAIEPLISAIKDEEKGVKGKAVMGYVIEGVAVLTGSIPNNYRLGTATKAATDALTNIKKRDRGEIWSVAWAIADIGKPAVEPLIAALKNKDADEAIRRRAPVALGRIGDPRAVDALITVLKDKDEDVRLSAVLALAKIGGTTAVEALIAALNDRNNDVRWTAVVALGNSKDPRAVKPLTDILLKDEQNGVRKEAAWALGKIGGTRAADALFAALKDKDNGVRWIAAVALANNKDPRALEPLLAALNDKDYRVRLSAAEVIRKIDDPRATEPLAAALKELPELLKNEHWTLKKDVANRLGRIGQPAVEALIAFLGDEDNEVRLSAADALGKIKDPRAVEPLLAILKGKPQMAWIEDKGRQIRVDIRGAAAASLGKIGDTRAIEPLISALQDKDLNVQKSAKEALVKISGNDLGQEPAKWQAWLAESKNKQSANPAQ